MRRFVDLTAMYIARRPAIPLLPVVAVLISLATGGAPHAETADQTAITTLLHRMFDKPGTQLVIVPIVVSGDHAIAGWTQGEMGGRALLRHRQDWTLILCAGDGITSAEALARAGVSTTEAAELAKKLAEAENSLPPQQIAMFSRFEGIMMMDGSDHQGGHEHGSGH